jgi:hypothetical protein
MWSGTVINIESRTLEGDPDGLDETLQGAFGAAPAVFESHLGNALLNFKDVAARRTFVDIDRHNVRLF